ncbi:P-loop containing nucleoside triphosphate hydrolase protein, partial [Jimgerdemannia flammicorona]
GAEGTEREGLEEDEETGVHLIEIADGDDAEGGQGTNAVDTKSRDYVDAMQGFLREQPAIVNPDIKLKGYQILGINWLLLLYRKGVSGILADEMGLGKTAQVISFLGRLYEMGDTGPHMVIVPSSTLENWMREFEKFCPKLVVKAYYGSQRARVFLRDDLLDDQDYQVLVTTYNMATGNKDDRSFLRKLRYEGHMVKNCASARYKHLMSLKSLLTFIMPNMFSDNEEEFRKVFKIKAPAGSSSSTTSSGRNMSQLLSRQRILRAKRMMAPFVLRRKKAQVLKDLPSKAERVERCGMTNAQSELYERLVEESKRSYETVMEEREEAKKGKAKGKGKGKQKDKELDGLVVTGSQVTKKTEKMANILMQLRKAADHPMLFRVKYTDSMLREMAKSIMKEEQYWDANLEYIFEVLYFIEFNASIVCRVNAHVSSLLTDFVWTQDMQVMSDFELRRLCLEHKSIERFGLKNEEWMHAGKVEKLKEILPECKRKGDRVLLFSQFTMMLDVLESVLDTLDIQYLRLDGQSKVEERQLLIDAFNDNIEITVFLLSTKAGGFGINLTSANVVVLYDLDFNPHNDKQAEDRAHRVGQTRNVTVIKLISERTIEEQILRMAEVKLRLDQHVSSSSRKDVDEEGGEGEEDGSVCDSENIVSLVRSALLAGKNLVE